MRPLVTGWYAVVRMCLEPSICMSCIQSTDSNCDPLSVVMVDGTPIKLNNLSTPTEAWITDCAVISLIGMASGHLVNLSMQVRRYV